MGETLDYINSMRCSGCYGCDEPEFCTESGFSEDADIDPELSFVWGSTRWHIVEGMTWTEDDSYGIFAWCGFASDGDEEYEDDNGTLLTVSYPTVCKHCRRIWERVYGGSDDH